jgi:hypothetical protein
MLKKFAIGSILLVATACSGVYQLTIEVLEPAAITLPGKVNHILIVNNTVPQPNNAGINRTYNDTLVTAYELDLDSMSWTVIDAFASTLRESHFFDKISLYKQPVRKDNEWMSRSLLPEEYRNQMFEKHDFDVIISIDRLLFALEEEVKHNTQEPLGDYTYAFISNKVKGGLNCDIYLYEKPDTVFSFTVRDSIIDKNTLVANSLDFLKTIPETFIDDLAYRLGEKLAYYIIPTWTVQERIIYTGNNSRMQEAFSYLKNGKWNKAESLWLILFDRESNKISKAQLANNIALANEIQDQLEIALHWAEQAKDNFPENSKEKTRANEYVSTLQQRIQSNRLLDIQRQGE